MSADNLVRALPFKKMTGQVVWRVLEVRLSGLPFELCHAMSTESRLKSFVEFEGPDAAKQARAAARRIARALPVCEYGTDVDDADQTPYTMEDLRAEAVKSGYDAQRVYQLREASDEDFADKEVEYWVNF